ncbi:cystathionine beta-lyase [Rhodospirillaceae bacterium KN72]|uniref:Cystathionine beta-lyase n=1 Tax=Pacificispira spongiicola TaxID=2729598 RepID=A0A7Y0DYU8_9PROT|nr:cystathionine beta-lyase [Pacificispira spongiicola]NMM44083.1 cystathionine beta-lyase [Pacificispira spongiicola]
MSSNKSTRDDTIAVHAGRRPLDNFGVVNPPVFRASTILHPTLDSWENRHKENVHKYGKHFVRYGLHGTPTQFSLRDALSEIEQAEDTALVPSGMAACAIPFLAYASPGAHFLITDNVYEPVRRLAEGYLKQLGCVIEYFDPRIGGGIANHIRPETKMIWLESPGSLTMELTDVPAVVAAAKKAGVVTGIDNTWSAGYFFKPLAIGVDISVHALTKYQGGHSDVMLGSVSCATPETFEKVQMAIAATGMGASPDDTYFVQRGLRSMPTRLKHHHEAGLKVAKWLEQRPEVRMVMHPGLESHPDHALWKRDFSGACGLFSILIDPPSRAALESMMENYNYFGIGASWGGFESLIVTSFPGRLRTAVPWTDSGTVLRLHIGLEDPDDLIADLEAGFDRLAKA